jgi:hypothetical protein
LNKYKKQAKIKILGLLVIVLILSNAVFAQKQNPTEIVKSFYKFHLGRTVLFSLHEVKLRKRWFTNELFQLLLVELKREDEFIRKNPNDKPHFGDGFPFQPFEECVIGEKIIRNLYEVKEISSDANKATVEVSFFVPKECEEQTEENLLAIYKIELIKTKNTWLLNDWVYSDGSRLSKDLKREKY